MTAPVEIKLRRKYRLVVRGRYKSSHNDQGHTARNKIGYEKHVARFGKPPVCAMVMRWPGGKTRMVKVPG